MMTIKKIAAHTGAAFALALAALTTTSPATAQVTAAAVELKNIEKGKTVLSEGSGYIYFHSSTRMNAAFIKTPNEEDFAEYEADWREELTEAQEKYPRRLERWKKRSATGRNPGEKPVEPTEETFSIGEIERRMMVFVGPQYVFDKGKDADGNKYFQYLHAVEPGEYTYYGPIFYSNGAAPLGTCLCMGSVRFEVKAGEITTIGDLIEGAWASDEAMAQGTPFWEPNPDRRRAPIDFTVPSSLSALPAVAAEFHASGKVNNFFRISIGRLPPMEGVLRYERDTVIDVRAELAAAEEARVKAEAVSAAEARLAEAKAEYSAADEAAKAAEAALAQEETPENQAAAETAIEAANAAEIAMIGAEEELAELNGTAPAADSETPVDAAEEAADAAADAVEEAAEEAADATAEAASD